MITRALSLAVLSASTILAARAPASATQPVASPSPVASPAPAATAPPAPRAAALPDASPIVATSRPTVPFADRAPLTIYPKDVWVDDRGRQIQAHGGGILKVADTWYWFGEDRSPDVDHTFRRVSCYASKDLVNWTFRKDVIQMTDPDNLGPHWVLERPKVFYNAKTKKYVLYMHVDGQTPNSRSSYAAARVGVAVSDTVDGNYTFLRSFRPLGKESRDIGQFIDDDGSAYLIFESRPTHGFYIARLSDDYLDVTEETSFVHAPLEGGALVHYNNLYYLVGSRMTGWDPNPNTFATSTSIHGPWSDFKDIAPPETKTYGSQSTLLLKVNGSQTATIIFMADCWNKHALWDSRYLWMPVTIGDGHLSVPAPHPWTLNVQTGHAGILP